MAWPREWRAEERTPVGRETWQSVTGKVVQSSPGGPGSHRNGKLQEEKGGTNNCFKQMKVPKQMALYLSNFVPRDYPSYASWGVLHKHSYTFFPKVLSIAMIAMVQDN